ncbi:hypothetical protein V5E97_11080 [Singulisphaera sp. Ch08]|uniref:Uncharacterized protein n=1 Tax=Singulisphaera sp. Ch08 TaxID=3120278 RepID=A0AAU7CN36_9BACT
MGRFKLAKRPTRFGISTLMLLVAASGIAVFSYITIAEKFADLERVRILYTSQVNINATHRKYFESHLKNETSLGFRSLLSDHAQYYAKLETKYANAALFPWKDVEPDPPLPSFIPTEEQLKQMSVSSVTLKPFTPAESKAKYGEIEIPRGIITPEIQPSYLPQKLSDLKSLSPK